MILRADTYLYDTNEVSRETGLECKDKSLAVQASKDEVDINTIVKRFGLTGQLPQNVRMPLTEEFVDLVDFQTALNAIKEADEAFMRMPAEVRARFDNDAVEFVEFATNPDNYEEAVKLGLAVKRPEKAPEEPPAQSTT